MQHRYNVSIGKSCEKCGKDTWLVYRGHNRCICGQYLWIERRDDTPASEGLKLKYVQGREVPENYRGWLQVTAGTAPRVQSEAQRVALEKARAARWSRTSLTSQIDGVR